MGLSVKIFKVGSHIVEVFLLYPSSPAGHEDALSRAASAMSPS